MAAGTIKRGYVPNRFEEDVLGRLGRLTRKDMKFVTPLGSGYPMVYICSPYAANPAYFTSLAKEYCKYAIDKRYQPVASHLFYPLFLDDRDELQREMGLTFGLKLLSFCKEVWVFRPTGGISSGMEKEIAEAIRLKIPVVYINDPKVYGKEGWDPIKSYDERQAAEAARKRGRPRRDASEEGGTA